MDKETAQEDEQEQPYSEYSDEELLSAVKSIKEKTTRNNIDLEKKRNNYPKKKNQKYLQNLFSMKIDILHFQSCSLEIASTIEDRKLNTENPPSFVQKRWEETCQICSQIKNGQEVKERVADTIINRYQSDFLVTKPSLISKLGQMTTLIIGLGTLFRAALEHPQLFKAVSDFFDSLCSAVDVKNCAPLGPLFFTDSVQGKPGQSAGHTPSPPKQPLSKREIRYVYSYMN